jgi:hypothetical protein
VKALGKGSIASLLGVFLSVATLLLWLALGGLVIACLGYAGLLALVAADIVSPSVMDGHLSVDQAGAKIAFEMDKGLGWQVVTPALAGAIVIVAGWLVVVHRLKRLCDTFTTAEPFRRENADHLRVIWITLLTIEISRYALLALTAAIVGVFGLPASAELSFHLNVDLTTWSAILVLIVLAEVFREGARMREEQDLTI